MKSKIFGSYRYPDTIIKTKKRKMSSLNPWDLPTPKSHITKQLELSCCMLAREVFLTKWEEKLKFDQTLLGLHKFHVAGNLFRT